MATLTWNCSIMDRIWSCICSCMYCMRWAGLAAMLNISCGACGRVGDQLPCIRGRAAGTAVEDELPRARSAPDECVR